MTAVGETEKAIRFFEKAIELDDELPAAFYALGSLFYQLGQYEEAAGLFEKALKKGLQDQDVYFMLGMCFVQLDKGLLAIPYLTRSVELESR